MEGSLTLLVTGLATALILLHALADVLLHRDASDPGQDLAE